MKIIDFFNLDAHFYNDPAFQDQLHERDYFRNDQLPDYYTTESLAATAKDLLSMRRKAIEKEREEISRDISNIQEIESFDESVFKIFEQLKAYNNRLSSFAKSQKDIIRDLGTLQQ